jgi:hypothetical protein
MYKLTGNIKMISPTVQVSDRFSKREFVVSDTNGMYPQDILFQATQDKCAILDTFQNGEQVEVSFNLRGREWTSPQGEVKYFNSLEAWRIEKVGNAMAQGMPADGPSAMNINPMDSNTPFANTADDDDLPF